MTTTETRKHWYADSIDEAVKTGNVEVTLKGLEMELKEDDGETMWTLSHYVLTAENVYENFHEYSVSEIEAEIALAEKEIAILRKYGHNGLADDYQEILDEVREEMKSDSRWN